MLIAWDGGLSSSMRARLAACIALPILLLAAVPSVAQPLELRGICPLSALLTVSGYPRATIVVGDSAAEEDWAAAAELADYVRYRLGGEAVVLSASNVTPSDLRERPVILVGGPVANRYAELPNEEAPLRFVMVGRLWTVRTPDNRHFGGMYHFGFAQATVNPWNPELPLVWVAGVDRYGTLGAVRGLLAYECRNSRVGAVLFVTYDDGRVRVRDEFLAPRRPAIWSSPPMSAAFLNAHTNCSSVLLTDAEERVWMINASYRGWLVPCMVDQDTFPIDSRFNAVHISNSSGSTVKIYLGVYADADGRSARIRLTPEDLLRWRSSWLTAVPGRGWVTLYADSERMFEDDVATLPWTGGRVAVKLNTLRTDGLTEFVFYVMPDELAFNWTTVNISEVQFFDVKLDVGPDGEPTTMRIELLDRDPSRGWITMRVSFTLDLGDGHLNLSDPGSVGDELRLVDSVGAFLEIVRNRLFLAREGPITVPVCVGLVSPGGSVDVSRLNVCSVARVGLYDSVVAYSP